LKETIIFLNNLNIFIYFNLSGIQIGWSLARLICCKSAASLILKAKRSSNHCCWKRNCTTYS